MILNRGNPKRGGNGTFFEGTLNDKKIIRVDKMKLYYDCKTRTEEYDQRKRLSDLNILQVLHIQNDRNLC